MRALVKWVRSNPASWRFAAQTGMSFFLNIGLTTFLCEGLALDEKIAYIYTLVFLFLLNFLGLRYFVYSARKGGFFQQFYGFFISTIGFRILEYTLYVLLVEVYEVDYRFAIVLVVPFSTLLKFFALRAFVFRSQ